MPKINMKEACDYTPGTDVPAATLLSLLARYPGNTSAALYGFGLAPQCAFRGGRTKNARAFERRRFYYLSVSRYQKLISPFRRIFS